MWKRLEQRILREREADSSRTRNTLLERLQASLAEQQNGAIFASTEQRRAERSAALQRIEFCTDQAIQHAAQLRILATQLSLTMNLPVRKRDSEYLSYEQAAALRNARRLCDIITAEANAITSRGEAPGRELGERLRNKHDDALATVIADLQSSFGLIKEDVPVL